MAPRARQPDEPRSAFGIGGTDAHVILEEAERLRVRRGTLPSRSDAAAAPLRREFGRAADAGRRRTAAVLRERAELALVDVAFTHAAAQGRTAPPSLRRRRRPRRGR